mmetsp:Transcript_16800/g.25568  ORF Transcript_16800/g.25568 Transcript_16800/m.25568 type:complete len:80 (-) Transcript_16800:511-750(-)
MKVNENHILVTRQLRQSLPAMEAEKHMQDQSPIMTEHVAHLPTQKQHLQLIMVLMQIKKFIDNHTRMTKPRPISNPTHS